MPSNRDIAWRLGQIRRLLSVHLGSDVTQEDMTTLLGFSAGVWSHWQTGHRQPSRKTIEHIADVMQSQGLHYVTQAWIAYGAGEGPPPVGYAPKRKPE